MRSRLFWGLPFVLLGTAALSEETCQDFATYQVCWPASDLVIYSGEQNGAAIFTISVMGINTSVDVTGAFENAAALKDEYLAGAQFFEGTYEELDADTEGVVMTFALSTPSDIPALAPLGRKAATPRIISIIQESGRMVVAETFFPNRFASEQDATWNTEKLDIHRRFTSYIRVPSS